MKTHTSGSILPTSPRQKPNFHPRGGLTRQIPHFPEPDGNAWDLPDVEISTTCTLPFVAILRNHSETFSELFQGGILCINNLIPKHLQFFTLEKSVSNVFVTVFRV